MSMEPCLKESELLRMTKDEIIEHIFIVYSEREEMSKALAEWWGIIESMKQNERFKDIYNHVGN